MLAVAGLCDMWTVKHIKIGLVLKLLLAKKHDHKEWVYIGHVEVLYVAKGSKFKTKSCGV